MKDKQIVTSKTEQLSKYSSAELTVWKYEKDGEDRFKIDRTITTSFDLSEDEFARFLGDQFIREMADTDPALYAMKELFNARNN